MPERRRRLEVALAAIDLYGSQRKIAQGLMADGTGPAIARAQSLFGGSGSPWHEQLTELLDRDTDAVLITDEHYPSRLRDVPGAPPILFTLGDQRLLEAGAVSMCGSRDVSEAGLAAARACGLRVAATGLTIVSGYAKGVDTEAHLAALQAGGTTIGVLAEGILHFRTKRVLAEAGLTPDRALVVSQFPPRQRWNVGAAMARNAVIVGLGQALIVIEAGETGGTMDAGKKALGMGRPVIALEFSNGTPPGNDILFELGAHRATTVRELSEVLSGVAHQARDKMGTAGQLAMPIGRTGAS